MPTRNQFHQDFPMSVLVSLLVTFLVIVLVLYLIARLPIDGRAKQIAQVIVIIIGIISLLRYLAVF
jgi:Tfp pilus assembly protein PilN